MSWSNITECLGSGCRGRELNLYVDQNQVRWASGTCGLGADAG